MKDMAEEAAALDDCAAGAAAYAAAMREVEVAAEAAEEEAAAGGVMGALLREAAAPPRPVHPGVSSRPPRTVSDLCQHWTKQPPEDRVTLTVVAAVLAECVNAARKHNGIFPPSEAEEVGAKTVTKIEPDLDSAAAKAAAAKAKAAAARAEAFKKRPTSTGDMLVVLCRLRANSFAVKRPAASPASPASPVPSTSASNVRDDESAVVEASEYIRMW